MRTSQYLLATQKETPSDAVVISHQLMLRAGMIRKLASGLYTAPGFLPQLSRLGARHQHFQRAGSVHFFTNDGFDLAHHRIRLNPPEENESL